MIQQPHRIELQPVGDPLHSLKRQVPFPPLQSADVGAVPAEHFGKGLLGKALVLPVLPEVISDGSLQIPLGHAWTVPEVLLDGLQTYK